MLSLGFTSGSDGKESTCSARDPGSTPRLGRSAGEGILAWKISWTEEPGRLQSTVFPLAKYLPKVTHTHTSHRWSLGHPQAPNPSHDDWQSNMSPHTTLVILPQLSPNTLLQGCSLLYDLNLKKRRK